nr:phage tail assembly protein [uncultured Roseococcus sp.]
MSSEPTKVTLHRPIKAHGEELHVLELREPTGRDLRICGLPYRVTQGEEIIVDSAVMARLVVSLASIPMSSVDQLSAPDFQEVTGVVMGFFQQAKPAAPVIPTSS